MGFEEIEIQLQLGDAVGGGAVGAEASEGGWGDIVHIVSPTVLTAPGRGQNCCFSTYLASKTAFYSF